MESVAEDPEEVREDGRHKSTILLESVGIGVPDHQLTSRIPVFCA